MSLLPASNLSSVALNSRNAESDDVTLQVSFSVFFVKTFPRGGSKVPTSRLVYFRNTGSDDATSFVSRVLRQRNNQKQKEEEQQLTKL